MMENGQWSLQMTIPLPVVHGGRHQKFNVPKDGTETQIPVIYLVDCSGLYLPGSRCPSLVNRCRTYFKKNAELSSAGVPQIAGVLGDCIAGGGYKPIISDVFMTEQVLYGYRRSRLDQRCKSLELTSLDIGGPEVHVHQSGCADSAK